MTRMTRVRGADIRSSGSPPKSAAISSTVFPALVHLPGDLDFLGLMTKRTGCPGRPGAGRSWCWRSTGTRADAHDHPDTLGVPSGQGLEGVVPPTLFVLANKGMAFSAAAAVPHVHLIDGVTPMRSERAPLTPKVEMVNYTTTHPHHGASAGCSE